MTRPIIRTGGIPTSLIPLTFPPGGSCTAASTGAITGPFPAAGGPWTTMGWLTAFWSFTAVPESPTRGCGGRRIRSLRKSTPSRGSTGIWRGGRSWAWRTRPSGTGPPGKALPIPPPGIRCISPPGITSGCRAGCSCTTGYPLTLRGIPFSMCSETAGPSYGRCPCFSTTIPIRRIWIPTERTTRQTRQGTSACAVPSGPEHRKCPKRRETRRCFWTLTKI